MSKGVLEDQERAEAFRQYLYHTYALGDKPGQAPHLDGQNGWKQIEILLSQIDGCLIRFLAPPTQGEVHRAEETLLKMSPLLNAHEINDKVTDQKGVERALRSSPRQANVSLAVRCFRTRWNHLSIEQRTKVPFYRHCRK